MSDNFKTCPNCEAISLLRIRTDKSEWLNWLRCEICGYMVKIKTRKKHDTVVDTETDKT